MSEPRFTMFAYPWDIERVGPRRFADQMSRLGVDAVAVATVYHSAEVLGATDGRLTTAEPGVAHLPLDGGHFAGIAPPVGGLAREAPNLFAELHDAVADVGIGLVAWTVALHQTTMAGMYPELAPVTCFGDPMAHGLCPAHQTVQCYVADLVDAIGATGLFDTVLLESIAYIPVGHGHPHELWTARFDPITRALLSLCFCDACTAAGTASDIDMAALRGWVSRELRRGWNGPLSMVRSDDDGTEALGLILGRPDLRSFIDVRLDTVVGLAETAVEHARRAGLRSWIASPVWARPLWTAWMQGVDPGRILPFADAYGLQAYYPTIGEVARELDHALRFGSADRLVLMQTMMRDHQPSLAVLLDKIGVARAAGVSEFTLYNYGMMSEPQLDWVGEAIAATRSSPAS